MTKISFITIGNELLKGTIVNTNASNVGLLLQKHGYQLDRVVTISDSAEAIQNALDQEWQQNEVVLMSGGLGPTKDDLTKHTLAKYFNSDWTFHGPTLKFLEERYSREGRQLNDLTRLQARVPDKCEVLFNDRGTAPGMMFREEGKFLFAMPGVPYEMLFMVEDKVIPFLKNQFPVSQFERKVFRLANIPESEAAQRMETIEAKLAEFIQIAYLPRADGLWIEARATMDNGNGQADSWMEGLGKIRGLFQDKIYAEGDLSLPALIKKVFDEKSLTLAVAESITGGGIQGKLVEVSGSSSYFKGGVISYDERVKIDQLGVPSELIKSKGVVSEEVAIAMAEGVRALLNADVGLATTGFAEAEGEKKAQVWIGLSSDKENDARWAYMRYPRLVNLDRAAHYAMQFCLKKVTNLF